MLGSKRLCLICFVIIFNLVFNLLFIGNSKADSPSLPVITGPDKMSLNEKAVLTVSGGCGEPYTWSLISGGGSLSPTTGSSVNYTAPSSNPDCANHPLIQVTDYAGQKVYKQIELTRNSQGVAFVGPWVKDDSSCTSDPATLMYPVVVAPQYACDGSFVGNTQRSGQCYVAYEPWSSSSPETCEAETMYGLVTWSCFTCQECFDYVTSDACTTGPTPAFCIGVTVGSVQDVRTQKMKDAGCCMEASLPPLPSPVTVSSCIKCDLSVSNFHATPTTINRIGGATTFSADITSSRPYSYTVTLAGFPQGGSAASSARITVPFTLPTDQSGKSLEPGTYQATLTVTRDDGECPLVSTSTDITITANDKDDTCPIANPDTPEIPSGSSLNAINGNVNHTQTLFTVPNSKLMSDFTLTYNSRDGYNGALGAGWTHNYNTVLQYNSIQDTYVLSTGGGGRTALYQNDNYYTSSISVYPILAKNSDNTLTLTYKNGSVYNFNAQGKLTSIADKNGNTLAVTYDASSNLIKIADSTGKTITLGYDGNNRISSMTDPNNNTYSLTYTGNFLTSVSSNNSLGTQTWTYTYDDNAFMLTKTDPLGNLYQYAYDTNHRVSQTTDPQGKIQTIQYEPDYSTTTVTEKDGGIWVYQYDPSLGVLTSKIDATGNPTYFSHDTNRNLISTYQYGVATGYTYDANNNVTTVTKFIPILPSLLQSGGIFKASYDNNDNLTYVAKAIQARSLLKSGGIVNASYRNNNYLTYVSNNSGSYRTYYTYNDQNLVTSITNPEGNITQYQYDANGNLTTIIDATNIITTQNQYDTRGNIISKTDALNNTTNMTYDQYNNLITVTDPKGNTTAMAYDSAGNMLSQTDALGNVTTFQYNSLNQMTQMTDPKGKITRYTYDYKGNRLSAIDANNNATQYVYDYKNHITQITDALNNITGMAYGTSGCASCGGVDKLTALTDAKSHTTAYVYDQVGNLVQETDPLGKITTYTYDGRGNVITRTNPDNITIYYGYDINNKLTQKGSSNSSHSVFEYDYAGNMTYAGNQNIAYQFTYDADNRITQITDSNGRTIQYQYDAAGKRIAMTMPDSSTIAYTYDFNNLLTQITTDLGAFTYAFDANNRRTTRTLPNGITSTYSYDQDSRLTGIQTAKNTTTIDSINYTYDNAGNRITKTQPAVNYNYTYDAIYRLTQATPSSGNPETFTYDQVGNRLTKLPDASPSSNETTQYTYDDENRLTGVQITQNGNIKQLSFTYDPFGRRISKTIIQDQIGTSCQSPNVCPRTINYIYDGQNIIVEYDQNGTITAKYTHGPNIDEPLAVQQGTNTYYYHADGLGSITALSNASGSIVQTYSYDSFGNITQTGSITQPYTFTAREYDSETGMYFYRARYYDPKVGRFVTKDPIGFKGGINQYVYVKNNPVNNVDPSGEWLGPAFLLTVYVIFLIEETYHMAHPEPLCSLKRPQPKDRRDETHEEPEPVFDPMTGPSGRVPAPR